LLDFTPYANGHAAPESQPASESQSRTDSQFTSDSQSQTDADVDDEVERERLARIAESRRKMAELEQDRPIWEAKARERAQSEQADELRRQQEAARAAEEEAASRRSQQPKESWRKRQERLVREEAERMRKESEARREEARRAEAEKREEARRRAEAERRAAAEAAQRRARFSGRWTARQALKHYEEVSETFDARARPSLDDPLLFKEVPWPLLANPLTIAVEDVSWEAVEAFFTAAKGFLRHQEYTHLLDRSAKRFHPDRWRSKGMFASIADEAMRGSMEVAVDAIAQAVVPLWKKARDEIK
jgi:hypothetical protein